MSLCSVSIDATEHLTGVYSFVCCRAGSDGTSGCFCAGNAMVSVTQSFDGGSKQMLNGTMVHDVFQKAAAAKDFSSVSLSRLADRALHSPQHLPDM